MQAILTSELPTSNPISGRGTQSQSGFSARAYMMTKPEAATELAVQRQPLFHLSLICINHQKRKRHHCQDCCVRKWGWG